MGFTVSVPDRRELVEPPVAQVRPWLKGDLVRSVLGRPGPGIPRPPQGGSGLLAGVRSRPLRLVAVDLVLDLRRPSAEQAHERCQLGDPGRVQGVPVSSQGGPKRWVAGDRGVPDAIDRGDRVPHPGPCRFPATCLQRTPGR